MIDKTMAGKANNNPKTNTIALAIIPKMFPVSEILAFLDLTKATICKINPAKAKHKAKEPKAEEEPAAASSKASLTATLIPIKGPTK